LKFSPHPPAKGLGMPDSPLVIVSHPSVELALKS